MKTTAEAESIAYNESKTAENEEKTVKRGRTKKTIYQEASDIHELQVSLENISQDDDKEITEYTINEMVKEAKWVLNNFNSYGCSLHEMLDGSEGKEAQKDAKKQVKQLQKFINKWSV